MENKHISKPFLPTLIDAVQYAKYVSFNDKPELKNLLAKACILHCSFAVEALANNMLQFISLGRQFTESIDKLDVIAKIELFSLLIKNKKLDRGLYPLQIFKDFIDIRNKYVHPKIKANALTIEDGNKFSKADKSLSRLKISSDPGNWGEQQSKECIVALLQAIDQLLLDDFELEMKSMSCMFMDFLSLKGLRGPIIPSNNEWVNWIEKECHYRPRFYCDHILKRYESANCIGSDGK